MVIRTISFLVMSLTCSFYGLCFGQSDTIKLINPSFEDHARAEKVPRGWYDCGFSGESAPDTHPSGAFEVFKAPSQGNTYLGMVVRDNDTWERVTQKLTNTIFPDQCYRFSLDLCRSELYKSLSRETGTVANYVSPIKLKIWGGSDVCSKTELLAESPLVKNFDWQQYDFKFEPHQSHTHIVLEAFYKQPALFPYNGNILVDNASAIIPISCNEKLTPIIETPVVNFLVPAEKNKKIRDNKFTVKINVENIKKKSEITLKVNGEIRKDFVFNFQKGVVSADVNKLKKGRNKISIEVANKKGIVKEQVILTYEPNPIIAEATNPVAAAERPTTEPIISEMSPNIEGFSRQQIKKGQAIKIKELSFNINDSTINKSAYQPLDGIYNFLRENTDVIVEIGGHTSGLCDAVFCNQLSTARAKAVTKYLNDRGIPMRQLKYKGYGKTKKIATNDTRLGRKKNQRVEIIILSMNG